MSENSEKHLKVSAIRNGTVLDHIPSSQLFKVIDILKLDKSEHAMTFGVNLDSKTLGKKAIIKIADRFFKDEEISRIALIAPKVSINIIENFEVVDKRHVSVPSKICGIAKCVNPMCVTNSENIQTKFTPIINGDYIDLLCDYCEKVTESFRLKIITGMQ